MNIFRLSGDMTHLLSIIVLLLKIHHTQSCRVIMLFSIQRFFSRFSLLQDGFVMRYLDLFTRYVSVYNTAMKLIFLASSFTIIYYMRFHPSVKQTYDAEHDSFKIIFLIGPAAVLALLINQEFSFMEILWTFSIYLEAVAILPQLIILQQTQNIDNLTGNYVFLLGTYRGLYLLNWIWRYFHEPGYRQWIVWLSGLVQTGIYADFFYYYFLAWQNNERLKLPA